MPRKKQQKSNGESPDNSSNGHKPGNGHKPRNRARPGGSRQSDALQSPLASEGAENVIDALFDLSELSDQVKQLFEAELARAHGLANMDQDQLNYRFYKLLNSQEFVEASFPPKESLWQGNIREEAGLGDGRIPLTPEIRAEIRTATDIAYSINTRSGPEAGGFQQKLLAQQQAERREIVEREDERQGWLGRLLG